MKRLIDLYLVAGVMMLVSCQPAELVIGFLGPLSGPNSQLGLDARSALELWVEETNLGGGIGGRSVVLLARDDEDDPVKARMALVDLSSSGVVVVIGPYLSSVMPGVMEVLNEGDILVISPTVSLGTVTGQDDLFLRNYPPVQVQATVLADEMIRRGIGTPFYVYDQGNALYSKAVVDTMIPLMEAAGAKAGGSWAFDGSHGAVLGIGEAMMAAGADGAVLVGSGFNAARITQEVRKRTDRIAFFGSNWPLTGELMEEGGASVEGMVLVDLADLAINRAYRRDFESRYRARYGRAPVFSSFLAWEAADMVKEALVRVPGTRVEARSIKKAILGIGSFRGMLSDFTLDPWGDAVRPYRLVEIRQGAVVSPPTR